MDDIFKRASVWGFDTAYRDAFGNMKEVEAGVFTRLLDGFCQISPGTPRNSRQRGPSRERGSVAAIELRSRPHGAMGASHGPHLGGGRRSRSADNLAAVRTPGGNIPPGRCDRHPCGRNARAGVADRLPAAGLPGWRASTAPDVGALLPALRRPLTGQLGPRRFRRSPGNGRPCGRSRLSRRRAQSAARAV